VKGIVELKLRRSRFGERAVGAGKAKAGTRGVEGTGTCGLIWFV
jgi:hypothetical protein